MSNGDESMSPAEFAKLMGAYPEPLGNPLPTYGGYMDNSAANFSWVQNNDYFGAEVHTDGSPRIHGHTKCDCDRCERGREGFYPNGWTCQDTGVVYRYKDAEGDGENCPKCGSEAHGNRICSHCDHEWEIDVGQFSADTDLTPTNHMNNSIGQVVPITNPMELPTNLIETEAGGGPEGQITPDIFSADFTTDGLTHAEKLSQHWLKGGHKYVLCEFCNERKPLGQMRRIAYDPEQDGGVRVRYSGYLSTYGVCDDCYRDHFKGHPVGKSVLHAETFEATQWWNRQTPTGHEKANDEHGGFYIQTDYDIGTIKEIFKDWKPKAYPYEKRITQDSFDNWCEDCGEIHDKEKFVHYQFYLPQSNSRRSRMRYVSGNYCSNDADCGANICESCYDKGNECEECGVIICDTCKGDSQYSTGDTLCQECLPEEYQAETFEAVNGVDYERKGEMVARYGDTASSGEMAFWVGLPRLKEALVALRPLDKHHKEKVAQFVKEWRFNESLIALTQAINEMSNGAGNLDVPYRKTFNAPYGGVGAIMDIGKSTPLENFTDEELTTSSAIHGDFDQASLNYSGHQNIEVKAEMEELTESIVDVSNRFGDSVGMISVEDTPLDERYMDDVDVEVQDMDGNIVDFVTIEGSRNPYEDDDDLEAESTLITTAKEHSGWVTLGSVTLGILAYLNRDMLMSLPNKVFNNETQELLDNPTELIENPDIGALDPAQYEELVVQSTGYAVDVIPMGLDGSFMGSRFGALPTERYVEYNDPGIGAHTDIALNRDEIYREPEMAMVQAAEGETVVKEAQAPGQSPYLSIDGQEPKDFNYRVIKETHPISLDPAVKPFIPQSMSGYTGNANRPPSVYNKMFNIGVLGQTPLFTPQDAGDIGASHAGSRKATPNKLGLNGSVGGPLSDKVNANYTDGTTSMSLAQWAIENTVSQSSDTEAVVIDRSSGAMKRVRRV